MDKELFNQINTAQSQLGEVNNVLTGGTISADHIQSAYERSKTVLESKIEELETPITSSIAETIQGAEQIALLRGILPEEEISALVEKQIADIEEVASIISENVDEPEKSRLLDSAERTLELIRGIGAVALQGEVVIADEKEDSQDVESTTSEDDNREMARVKEHTSTSQGVDETNSSQENQPKQNISITVKGTSVKIGNYGKEVSLNSKRSKKEGIAEARQIALEKIAEQGTLKSTEFTKILEDLGMDDVSTYALRWLESLTYRGTKLIERNGKRGHCAAYSVNPRFNLAIIHDNDDSSENISVEENSAKDESSDQETAANQKEEIKLDAMHLASVLIRLKSFNPLIQANGLQPIEDALITELRESGSLDRLSGENLTEIRMQAYQALSESIEDESYLELDIFEGDKAPNAEDYLFDILNDEKSRNLFKTLLTATGSIEADKKMSCLVRSENGEIIYQRDVQIDRINGDVIREKIFVDGELMEFITVIKDSNTEIEIEKTAKTLSVAEESVDLEVLSEEIVDLEDGQAIDLQETVTTETIAEPVVETDNLRDVFTEKEKIAIDYVIQRAAELARILANSSYKDLDLDNEYRLNLLSGVFNSLVKSIKKQRISLNAQNRKSGGRVGVLTPRDAIMYMIMYSGKDKGVVKLFKKKTEVAMAALEAGINIGLSGEAA